jgi:uncharacterized protein DUF3592
MLALKVEKSRRTVGLRTLLFTLGVLAGLCCIVTALAFAYDVYHESQVSHWPSASGTITHSSVERLKSGRLTAWLVLIDLRYSAGAQTVQTSLESRVTSSSVTTREMRQWVAQHPAGTSFTLRYDPAHQATVVPDGEDVPQGGPKSPEDRNALAIFFILAVVLIGLGRILPVRS